MLPQPPVDGPLVASSGYDLINRRSVSLPFGAGEIGLAPTELGLGLLLALALLAYWYRRIL